MHAIAAPEAIFGRRSGDASAMSHAIAGNAGRMYIGSFELETLKKAITTTDQTSSKRSTLSEPWRGALQASRIAPGNAPVHGRRPSATMGTKYHHGPGRW